MTNIDLMSYTCFELSLALDLRMSTCDTSVNILGFANSQRWSYYNRVWLLWRCTSTQKTNVYKYDYLRTYLRMSTITLGGSGDVASVGREGIKLLLIREI